jgi:hypothetical protein
MLGYFLAGLTMKYTSISKALRIAYIVCFTGGALYLSIGHTSEALLPVLVILSRIGTTMCFNMGYISVPRLFPTKFVAFVFGIVNVVAHVFACFAPLVAEIRDPYPFTVFLGAIVISFMCTFYLEELDDAKKR